jgi:hypothetical protein
MGTEETYRFTKQGVEPRLKYENCPKGTQNGWDHHVIYSICVRENVVNGQVVTGTRNRLHSETVTLLVFLHESLPLHRDINFQRFLDTMEMDGDVELFGD